MGRNGRPAQARRLSQVGAARAYRVTARYDVRTSGRPRTREAHGPRYSRSRRGNFPFFAPLHARSADDLSWWRVHGLRQRSEHVRCASAVWPTKGLRARAREIQLKRSCHAY
jgi:hypothetical protein